MVRMKVKYMTLMPSLICAPLGPSFFHYFYNKNEHIKNGSISGYEFDFIGTLQHGQNNPDNHHEGHGGFHISEIENVILEDGGTIPSNMVIWAAGIRGNVPGGVDKSLIVRGNRIKVDRYCQMQGSKNIYIIGDLAYMETPKWPKGHPQLAFQWSTCHWE